MVSWRKYFCSPLKLLHQFESLVSVLLALLRPVGYLIQEFPLAQLPPNHLEPKYLSVFLVKIPGQLIQNVVDF